MKLFLQILSIFLLSLLTSCSYKVGAVSDPGFKTIFIENFKSDITEPGLENLVTTTVIQQFQKDGTLTVTDAEHAEAILRGNITGFKLSPVRYSRANELTPVEADMIIEVKYTLTKRGETKPMKEGAAAGSSSFFIGNDLQSDKRQGIPIASEKLGRNLVSNLVEGSW